MSSYSSIVPSARQCGVALITSLIFLVLLTIFGVTAARMSSLEERMAGNMRDRNVALRAAEMGLRDAERDILYSLRTDGRPRIEGLDGFRDDCTSGLCRGWNRDPQTAGLWTGDDPPSYQYGELTNAQPIESESVRVSAPPQYLIEGVRKTPPGGGLTYYYRVTVRAQGQNPNTVVWLQEVFAPKF